MNIEHFRRKLREEQNELTRQQIVQLLAAEEAKLASLIHAPEKHFGKSKS
jgi:hypothetical protein